MRIIINLILCSFLLEIVYSYTTYDQRQTGDLNIQVEVKDIQLFAFMKGNKEEYVDYDYAYDYSEMTIKPQHSSKPKPNVTSTVTPSSITNITTTAATLENTSEVAISTDIKIKNETNIPVNENINFKNSTTAPSFDLNARVGT